jgi:hypothetical protein
VYKSSTLNKSSLNLFLFGKTSSSSSTVVRPYHCATPFQSASKGKEGTAIPGSKKVDPSFENVSGKVPRILFPLTSPPAIK